MTSCPVSGRYLGTRGALQVELRIDVDGARPTNRVSADYFDRSGAVPAYVSSMRLDAPTISRTATQITVSGRALFSKGPARRIRITIALVDAGHAPATLQHQSAGGGQTLVCECAFESDRFREVSMEEACERGVDRPPPHDTGSLPSGGPARTLSSVEAYGEAGIELKSSGHATVIDVSLTGDDAAWSDAELHAAMERHFSQLEADPRWAIWLLHAANHVDPALAGLMFDRQGAQRQGCAVFYGSEPATTDEQRRDRLYNCVHELGHGFNLLHCWQKSLATPPVESRPDALSWMNYPDRDERGAPEFFRRFGFEFDDAEVVHLRHAFRENVIMGGKPFSGGAARERGGGWAEERQDPTLRLKLTAPRSFAQHFPVTVGTELSTTKRGGARAPRTLGPRSGTVNIAILPPSGTETLFEPLLLHCRGPEFATLAPGGATVRDFPFIHYGKQGFAFEEPGTYRLQARYTAPDGLIALSNSVTLRVLAPVSLDERRVGELASDPQVGKLFSLMGSRDRDLSDGDEKLQEIIERYPAHPLAAVARVVRATSLARPFKTIDAAGHLQTQRAEVGQALSLIAPVVDVGAAQEVAAGATGEVAQRRAFASALTRLGTKPGISSAVDGFVNSRRREIAIVRKGLRPPPGKRPRPRPRPIDPNGGQAGSASSAAS